jgi:hypothetical protein
VIGVGGKKRQNKTATAGECWTHPYPKIQKYPKVILTVTTSLDVFITDLFTSCNIMQHHAGHESMDPMKFLGIFDASNV